MKWFRWYNGFNVAIGKKHQHEAQVLDLAKKSCTREYVKELADFIAKKYPASADKLLPELRKIYKSIKK